MTLTAKFGKQNEVARKETKPSSHWLLKTNQNTNWDKPNQNPNLEPNQNFHRNETKPKSPLEQTKQKSPTATKQSKTIISRNNLNDQKEASQVKDVKK
jgi:hypothetical protein